LGEFHSKLRALTEKKLEKNMMFPGLADKYNQNSRKAQKIVFEAGIVRPLLEATRQKMGREDDSPGAGQRQADALAALIQLESDILARGSGTNNGQLSPEGAKKFLTVFQNYVAGKEVPVDTNLIAVMAWTYSTNDESKGKWPPARFSGSPRGTNTLAANPGINNGLAQFVRNATNGVKLLLTDWPQILSVRASVKTFADSEDALFSTAKAEVDDKFVQAQHAVDVARSNLVEQLKKAGQQPLFAGRVSLTNALQQFQSNITASAGAALARVRAVNETAMARHPDPLFREIKERLDTVQASVSDQLATLLKGDEMKDFKALDESCLADMSFNKRADFYAAAQKIMSEKPFGREPLLGLMGKPLEKVIKEKVEAIGTDAAAYNGPRKAEFATAIGYHLKRATRAQSEAFFTAYLAEASKRLGAETGFPLVSDLKRLTTVERFTAASKDLKYVTDDLSSGVFKKYAADERSADWKKFMASVVGQQGIANSLLRDDSFGLCTISMSGSSDGTHSKDVWRDDWFHTKLVFDGSTAEAIRNSMEGDQKIGDAPVQQPIQLILIRNANDPKSVTYPIKTEGWGPLWLVHKYKGERDKMDPKLWRVEFPVKDPGPNGWVRLKLKFESVLPELDKWPAQ
ncbi:MAG TPA: hypothetical protein VMZ27_14785, partial [Candidatus Saccharimonadales bacterium]|nr:hypothetical protein [Candidatus Saccharimonadales bacterium]